MYKLKDGDVVKILPFIEDGKQVWLKENVIISKDGEARIFKNSIIINKLRYEHSKNSGGSKISFTIRYYSNALVNNELNLITVGARLKKLIDSDNDIYVLDSNKCLFILVKEVNTAIGMLPNYDDSYIDNYDNLELDSKIIDSLENFNEYNDKIKPGNNEDLRLIFGDIYNEVVSNERESKINQIINV
jgi:hypothetical protein